MTFDEVVDDRIWEGIYRQPARVLHRCFPGEDLRVMDENSPGCKITRRNEPTGAIFLDVYCLVCGSKFTMPHRHG